MEKYSYIWIFKGENSHFSSAVFTEQKDAETWIANNLLSGILTKYPIDISVYDWAIQMKYFSPKKDHEFSNEFIQKFSSAAQEHYHFSNGVKE